MMVLLNESSIRDQILNISVDVARIAEFTLEGRRETLVNRLILVLDRNVQELSQGNLSEQFKLVLPNFIKEFNNLIHNRHKENNKLWAVKLLTWANILQHRASLLV